jgi:hypothetical protein
MGGDKQFNPTFRFPTLHSLPVLAVSIDGSRFLLHLPKKFLEN